MWSIAVITAAIAVIMLIHNVRIKHELRCIRNELARSAEHSYNRQISIKLFDNDVSALVKEINTAIDRQKILKYENEHSEKLLKQSISDIAHDLRTPLSVIKGNLQLIMSNGSISGNDLAYLGTCLEKTDVLRNMADDFFELTLLESEHQDIELSNVNMTNLLMKFIADSESVIRIAGLTPEINFPPKPVIALANEQMTARMLGNLLGNVVKYAKEKFSITLSSENDKCFITFENELSSDNFPDTEHIFDRCYRADKSRNSGGTGLGLYIFRLLAEKQNGNVGAELKGNCIKIHASFKTAS